MANILDAIKILITGDGEQFREEVDLNEQKWQEFRDSLNDLDTLVDVHLEDEDAKLKIDEIRALLDELKLKSTNIDLNDELAYEKIEEVKTMLDELKLKTEDIHLDDADAITKIEDLKLKLDELDLKHEEVHIDTEEAKRRIDEIKAEIETIQFESRFDVDDEEAKRKIEELRLELDELHDKTIIVDVIETKEGDAVDEAEGGNKETGGGGGADKAAQSGNVLANAILTLLPLLSPLTAALTSATLSLGAAFSAAGAGVVGFAAVAKPNITEVTTATNNVKAAQDAYNKAVTDKQRQAALQQEKQAWSGLSGEQTKAVQALLQFEQFWKTFTAEFQTPVLSVFISALQFLQTALPTLAPIINGAGKAFTDLFNSAANAFKNSDTVKAFIAFLSADAGPAIEAFGKTIGNLLTAFMALFTGFAPEAVNMQNGLVSLTQRFAEWSEAWTKSQGFQQFVEYTKTNGATLLSLLGKVGDLVIQILKDMAPVGQVMLQALTAVVGWVDKIAQSNPHLVELVMIAISAFNAFKLLTPVIEGLQVAFEALATAESIADLLNPVGWVILAVTALVALAAVIYDHWGPIKAWLIKVWDDVVAAVQAAVAFLSKAWSDFTTWLTGLWSGFTKTASDLWSGITGGIQNIWNGFKAWIVSVAQATLQPIVDAFNWMYNHNYYFKELVDFIRGKWQEIRKDVSAFWNLITTDIEAFWNTLVTDATNIINGVRTGISTIWTNITTDVKAFWSSIENAVSGWFKTIVGDVDTVLGPIFDKIAGIWTNIQNTVGTWVGNVRTAISNEWTTLVNDAETWGENLITMFAQGITSSISKVVSAAKSAAQAVASFLGFHSPTEDGPAADSDTWAPNFVRMFSDGLVKGAGAVANASQRMIDPLKNALGVQAVSAGVAGMVAGGNLATAGGMARQLSNPVINVSPQYTIEGNVYGVNDLEKVINDLNRKNLVPLLQDALQQASRSIG